MAFSYAIEAAHGRPTTQDPQPAAKHLVLIDSAGSGGRVAKVFLPSLEEVAEFDATAPEVLSMIEGLVPAHDAAQPRWDAALMEHSVGERMQANVYTLDV